MSGSERSKARPRVGISACLLGERVRYDGAHKLDACLRDLLGPFVEWVPVCPEVGCGLGVPREAMRLAGKTKMGTVPRSGDSPHFPPRLVTRKTGVDHTERMQAWAERRLAEIEKPGLDGFVFKARSPSCGLRVEVVDGSGVAAGFAPGLFARALMDRFPHLPVEEDERLRDPVVREEFLERVRRRPGG